MRAMHALRGLADTRWQDVSEARQAAGPEQSAPFGAVDIDRAAGSGGITAPPLLDEAVFGCAGCLRATRYGNCGDPVAAGLSDTFRLVAHPALGAGCPARLPFNESEGTAYWRVHGPSGHMDVAVCPPLPLEAVQARHPGAVRIEPILPGEAWSS